MQSISKIELFRQVKLSIKRNRKYLLVGIDVSKKSSIACFYNVEKDVLLKKYLVEHAYEEFKNSHTKSSK